MEYLTGALKPLAWKSRFSYTIRQHRNIVDIQTVGWTRLLSYETPFLPVVFVEYASHGTLSQYLSSNKVDPAIKNSIALEIAQGLQALHSCGIVHGDLKLDNVLVFPYSDGKYPVQAKISDFGSSVLDNGDYHKLQGCTPPWNAPEWHKNITPYLLHKSDLYSFGLLVWCLTLDGKHPLEFLDSARLEARKGSNFLLQDAIQSIEQHYDARLLLRNTIEDHSRFFIYICTRSLSPARFFKPLYNLTLRKETWV